MKKRHKLKSLSEPNDAMIAELIREIRNANTKKSETSSRSSAIQQSMTDMSLEQLAIRVAKLEAQNRGLAALLEAKFASQIGTSSRALPAC